jgi:DNA replication and repair protein RecF
MLLKRLKLKNFRNLDGEFELSDKVNVIVGENGIGKTNFLEAVTYLASGKSFRTNAETNVVKKDYSSRIPQMIFARIEGELIDGIGNKSTREIIFEKTETTNGNGCKKTLKIDGTRKSLSLFTESFHTVVFSPNTINLVIDSPSVRRRDLDDFLSVLDEKYLGIITEYKKVLRSRNKVLEAILQRKSQRSELKFWNDKLVDLGAKVIYKRIQLLKKINTEILKLARNVFNLEVDELKVDYVSKFSKIEELEKIAYALENKLNTNIDKEVNAGITLYGPQRDDLRFLLNGDDLKEFGSRGQQRLNAFIYKLSQWDVLRKKDETRPLLLLDDIFSELDERVCRNVSKLITDLDVQTLLTTTHKEHVGDYFKEDVNVLNFD